MKKLIALISAGAVTVSLLSGCADTESGSAKEERCSVVVTMPPEAEPEMGFDPVRGWGTGEHAHEPLIQSTLTVVTTDLKIDKDLADDYEVSEDGMTWTVVLRDDVRFTDGEKLTAADVAFTYNNCRMQDNISDFSMLREAVAVDDYTVEFHMNTPFAIWPYTMATVGIVPKHSYGEGYGRAPVGSGRYILKEWDEGQKVILEANPDYYGDEIKVRKLTILFAEDEESLDKARSGEADVAYTPAPVADQSPEGYNLLEVDTVDTLGFNLPAVGRHFSGEGEFGNDVTADLALRRAVNMGIDRERVVEKVLRGYGSPAYSVCDKMLWYNTDSEVEYDPEEARRILEQGGWKAGPDGIRRKKDVKAEFTLVYPETDVVRRGAAGEIADQLEALGILVKIEGAGWDETAGRAQSQPVMWGWGAYTPMELYNIYHTRPDSGYAAYSPYDNKTVDRYIDEALQAPTLETSYEFWQKAQWDGETGVTQEGDIPWIWICSMEHLYYVRDGLDVGEQKVHAHGHGWSIVDNVDQWEIKNT